MPDCAIYETCRLIRRDSFVESSMFFKCPEGYLFDSQLEPEPDCAPADQVKSCNDVVIPTTIPKAEFQFSNL